MTNTAHREIEERLKRLAIHLTWSDARSRTKHGTAFFVTGDGIALTAFHNIEETLAVEPSAWLAGRWQGQDLRLRWKLPQEDHRKWQQDHDIAVLQADPTPEGIATLAAGYLDPALNESQRGSHWRGCRVFVAGFGRGQAYELAAGSGLVNDLNPVETIAIQGKTRDVLSFGSTLVENGYDHGPGLSGSPVYSSADGSIVGITIAARTKLHATELWPIYKNWDESSSFLKRIRRRMGRVAPPGAWTAAAVAVCLLVLASGGWMWWRQAKHAIPEQLGAQVSRIDEGVAEPVQDGSVFKVGERVRFHFTSPQDGHLYVVDQEIVAGQAQQPLIIFPTLRTGAGRNRVKAGMSVDFPSEEDMPPYLEAAAPDEPGYEGELLTLLVFPNPLPVALQETPVPLEPALFSLDGLRPRAFIHPLAPSADAVAMRRIRLEVSR